ncbi:MAG: DUF1364 family protein [Terriglobia bacterium]|nr:DUF1364 family protein [Terriglobia bacterium]
MSDWLTKLARGMPCQIRLPGCLSGTETVVACHYRLAGLCGVGMKPDSILCAWGCQHCHDCCDGRKKLIGWTHEMLRLAHAEGVIRTIARLISMGKIGALKRGVEAA